MVNASGIFDSSSEKDAESCPRPLRRSKSVASSGANTCTCVSPARLLKLLDHVTVRFDCNTTSVEQNMNRDNDTSGELSESDTENKIQANTGQLNDEELSDLYD